MVSQSHKKSGVFSNLRQRKNMKRENSFFLASSQREIAEKASPHPGKSPVDSGYRLVEQLVGGSKQ
jgi:hypothetical protein